MSGEALTIKQSNFLDKYFETGNATEAAMCTYDVKNRKVARNIGSENLAKLGNVVRQMMEERGLTLPLLIETVKVAIGANKRRRDFETGEVWYEPDHKTRLQAVDRAARWLGLESDKFTGIKLKKGDMSVEFVEHEK